jgi:hypothetical protein
MHDTFRCGSLPHEGFGPTSPSCACRSCRMPHPPMRDCPPAADNLCVANPAWWHGTQTPLTDLGEGRDRGSQLLFADIERQERRVWWSARSGDVDASKAARTPRAQIAHSGLGIANVLPAKGGLTAARTVVQIRAPTVLREGGNGSQPGRSVRHGFSDGGSLR